MRFPWTTRPIERWDGKQTPSDRRRRSPFRTSQSAAIDLLERELQKLGARAGVMEIDCRPGDLRLDGRLRAGARPVGPRVIISAETSHGWLKWPCDTFTTSDANLYAIALTLEKLRAIDRYGVTSHGEQYTGWIAIPASTHADDPVEAAWELLVMTAAGERASAVRSEHRTRETALRYFREAAKVAHPDMGGTAEQFDALWRARDTILHALNDGGAR